MPACSLFSRSKIHFWLITNALRSARANVFVECQLMLSDKCLKLSQGSCPSFRLCQMSPLVEEDNSYTGGDWAVCSLKGLTLPYGATIRWRKECGCFNWNFTNLNFHLIRRSWYPRIYIPAFISCLIITIFLQYFRLVSLGWMFSPILFLVYSETSWHCQCVIKILQKHENAY